MLCSDGCVVLSLLHCVFVVVVCCGWVFCCTVLSCVFGGRLLLCFVVLCCVVFVITFVLYGSCDFLPCLFFFFWVYGPWPLVFVL